MVQNSGQNQILVHRRSKCRNIVHNICNSGLSARTRALSIMRYFAVDNFISIFIFQPKIFRFLYKGKLFTRIFEMLFYLGGKLFYKRNYIGTIG